MTRGPTPKLVVVEKPAEPEAIKVPAWCPRNCRDDYPRLVRTLQSKGMWDEGKVDMLEAYLRALSTARAAQRSVERIGRFTKKPGERAQAHPGLQVMQAADMQLRMLGTRLGLLPSSRDALDRAGRDTREVDEDDDFGDI